MPLRVVYFGTYREEYSRNRIMQQALRSVDVEVSVCHEPLWLGFQDREDTAAGGWLRPQFWLRLMRVYSRLLGRGLRLRDYDVMVCGYPGQLDVLLAWLISRLHGKPLVWDVYISIYLVSLERKLSRRSAFSVQVLRRLEWLAVRIPDRLVQETRSYADWMCDTHHIAPERFCIIPAGADENLFTPSDLPLATDSFKVIYYGTYIPNHHVPTIVQAAALLQDLPAVQFELIGEGPDLQVCKSLAKELGLANLTFSPWLTQDALGLYMQNASLILGAFSDTPQSLMTVHNKIIEGMAVGRPVLTGDSQAVRDVLQVGNEVLVCERLSPEALAEAIRGIYNNPILCQKLSTNGRKAFLERHTFKVLGGRFLDCLESVLRVRV